MSAEEQVRFESKRDQQNVPNKLSAVVADFQLLAHLLDSICCDLLDTAKKMLQRTQIFESLFLSSFSLLHLSKGFWYFDFIWLGVLLFCNLILLGNNYL